MDRAGLIFEPLKLHGGLFAMTALELLGMALVLLGNTDRLHVGMAIVSHVIVGGAVDHEHSHGSLGAFIADLMAIIIADAVGNASR